MPDVVITQSLPASYYLNLLTSEYRTSPKFNEWLLTSLQIATDISDCLHFITPAFDLDLAIGVQLDTVGLYHNVSRIVPFQPSGGVSPVLDDATYRLLIRATIAQDEWDGTQGSLYPIWNDLFPGGTLVIIDNQNMSATIIMTGTFTSIIQDLITHGMIVPRPQAVEYDYVFGVLPFFGFGFNNSYIAGFGIGHWA